MYQIIERVPNLTVLAGPKSENVLCRLIMVFDIFKTLCSLSKEILATSLKIIGNIIQINKLENFIKTSESEVR